MSDTSTTEQLSAGSSEHTGHGRHRGPVAAQESESAPHGRHRKPAQETAEAAA
ncbi:hypothetical protein [Streptomyces argyrophylli]|uniref:Uncharacterized protein n=1 Tax=Streptomyces argyrophylli TaxID=2726118 RepID=A0A6M4PM20_9ACTN|nr:hypothetical protein [Streptomyces argyrophyllae]QJS12245.1 hypothetical protein HKX69_24430 [Streptomyces argyrophyllae]